MEIERMSYKGYEWSVGTEEVERGIFRFSISVPVDVEDINLYWMDGNPPTMIDTGPYIPGLYNSLVSRFRDMGVAQPGRVVVTHGHIDHYGVAREFARKMGCKIWVHKEDRDRVARHEEMLKVCAKYYRGIAAEWGALPAFQRMVTQVMGGFSTLAHSAPVDRELEGGEVFGDNDLMGKVYHCPGHSAGEIIIHLHGKGLVFTGDHLLESITPNPELYFPPRGGMMCGLGDYVASLAKVVSLKAKTALPGHGPPFADPAGRAVEILKHHKERKRLILELVKSGHCDLMDLSRELFPEELKGDDPLQYFLAAKEVLGHLEILGLEGLVSFTEQDGKRVAVA